MNDLHTYKYIKLNSFTSKKTQNDKSNKSVLTVIVKSVTENSLHFNSVDNILKTIALNKILIKSLLLSFFFYLKAYFKMWWFLNIRKYSIIIE